MCCTKNYSNSLNYFIRFHIYPDTKIIKTKAGNSVLISLSNGEGWLLKSKTNNFEIEMSSVGRVFISVLLSVIFNPLKHWEIFLPYILTIGY